MDRQRTGEILRGNPWFRGLPPALARAILAHGEICDFPDGSRIYGEQDLPDGLYAVLEGEVRLILHAEDGRQVLFKLCRPGSWFGEVSMFDGLPRLQNAEAVGPVRLLRLGNAPFAEIVGGEPAAWRFFAQILTRHLREALAYIVDSQLQALPARLARRLLTLARPGEDGAIRIRLTQEEIAAMMGVSRQTLNRVLNDWKRQGILRLDYAHVTVTDPAALARVVGPARRSGG